MSRALYILAVCVGSAGCAIWAALWLGNALLWLYDATGGAA